MNTKEKIVKLSYYASEDTRTRLRILAAKTGVKQTAIIDAAVQAYLKEHDGED